ncbi:MAG TPA: nodulation protein NfeD [Chitinophagaceae bacterium]|nr:nodulation protein NfeD [Chitinophagaceae bacterium]
MLSLFICHTLSADFSNLQKGLFSLLLLMKPILSYCLFLFLFPAVIKAQTVISMKIDGSINPSSADFIHSGIERAAREKAECIIIHLNTPGGLLKSTRVIVSDILASPVPVVVYVSPDGAHAGSAGVFVTLAAHIAAMAPGTNIGAAHPVALQNQMDSTMNEKATNDAAAFIRTIAEKRHRNIEWAENAVRKSFSYSETEALEDSAIDIIARNETELLALINGKTVELISGKKTLNTASAIVKEQKMSVWEKILDIISDPNIAYILFLLGMYGLIFELYNPGSMLPGIVGVIALILALYSMHTLPINYAGLALIIFAVILFLLEIKIVSHGLLAIGGVISLLLGSMMLIKSNSSLEMVKISWGVIIGATIVSALFFLFIVGFGIRAQRRKVVTGIEGLVGDTGEAMEVLSPTGTIRVQGEIWNAESLSGKIDKGEKVRIKEMKNLKLFVERINNI